MTAPDELALELFIADNHKQPRETSIADWEYFLDSNNFQGQVEHYRDMATGAIAAGYRKPRTITTAEELDALPVYSVVLSDGFAHQKYSDQDPYSWAGDGRFYSTNQITLPATVLREGNQP